MNSQQSRAIAERIAFGHAFEKHVLERKEFPELTDRTAFALAIERVLTSPSIRKTLLRGRVAYWSHTEKLLVIWDPSAVDQGTAYRPISGDVELNFLS